MSSFSCHPAGKPFLLGPPHCVSWEKKQHCICTILPIAPTLSFSPPCHSHAIRRLQPVILDYLASKLLSSKDLVVVSPDVGGVARARAFAKKLSDAPLAIVDKRRQGHNVAEVSDVKAMERREGGWGDGAVRWTALLRGCESEGLRQEGSGCSPGESGRTRQEENVARVRGGWRRSVISRAIQRAHYAPRLW